ncbi:MAG: cyclic pyranopterin monophosphate synthase MoaC [Gemmatimonadaceae bacterium]
MRDFTHLDESGTARMVDVSQKPATERLARASGLITMDPETLQAIRDNSLKKGDVLAVSRVAGIMAAKRTAELIPLCHPLPLSDIQVDLTLDDALPGIRAEATVVTVAPTGVEMEAIIAVSVTLITIYDMVKGVDKGMEIGEIALREKRGGRSGHFLRS